MMRASVRRERTRGPCVGAGTAGPRRPRPGRLDGVSPGGV